MLTIEQFSIFNTRARYDITIGLGIYLSTCYFKKTEIAFYSLYDFVVEVWKAPATDRVLKVEPSLSKKNNLLGWPSATCLN